MPLSVPSAYSTKNRSPSACSSNVRQTRARLSIRSSLGTSLSLKIRRHSSISDIFSANQALIPCTPAVRFLSPVAQKTKVRRYSRSEEPMFPHRFFFYQKYSKTPVLFFHCSSVSFMIQISFRIRKLFHGDLFVRKIHSFFLLYPFPATGTVTAVNFLAFYFFIGPYFIVIPLAAF